MAGAEATGGDANERVSRLAKDGLDANERVGRLEVRADSCAPLPLHSYTQGGPRMTPVAPPCSPSSTLCRGEGYTPSYGPLSLALTRREGRL